MSAEDPTSDTSALLSFTAENVRSYRDEVHLSQLVTRMADKDVVRNLSVVGSAKPLQVLPVTGVFGANASGKTAILEAMGDMRTVVLDSFRMKRTDRHGELPPRNPIYRRPFGLDVESRDRPSRFEIELIISGVRWQYGFEINDERVMYEYAFHFPRGRRALVLHRDKLDVEWGSRFRAVGRASERFTDDSTLSLSVAAHASDDNIYDLYSWFKTNLRLAASYNRRSRAYFTAELMRSDRIKGRALSLLRYADLGVTDVELVEPDPDVVEQVRKALQSTQNFDETIDDLDHLVLDDTLRLIHAASSNEASFAPEDESLGTRVWLSMIGPILQTLDEGSVLLADELDASLHPHLVRKLISLFQDPRTNPRCAQLVFNSHDTTILGNSDRGAIGRDQIWFTRKGLDGVTHLYPLSDFSPRRDEALERRYLQGRYGAVPSLNPAEIERALGFVEA